MIIHLLHGALSEQHLNIQKAILIDAATVIDKMDSLILIG